MVIVVVTYCVDVNVGVAAVSVGMVAPAHKQALLYRAAPEHALAYVGTGLADDGAADRARTGASSSRLLSRDELAPGPIVVVTIDVVTMVPRGENA